MSLRLACFVTSTFDQSDWLKLLGIAGAAVALYFIAKRLGGGDEAAPPPMDTSSSTQLASGHTDLTQSQGSQDSEKEDDSGNQDYEEQPITAEEEVQPRNVQIRDWNFAKFEIEAGPPNRDSFVDELSVNLFDESTGHAWNQTYSVATPMGLEKMLRDDKSSFMFLPQILVLNRYDVNTLRKAVLDDLGAMEEERGDVPPDASDAATAGKQD